MGTQIVAYPLELSQVQLRAFIEFISLGDKLSSFLFQQGSPNYGIVDVMRWDKACLAVFYIHVTGSLFGYLPEYNLQLDLGHIEGLRSLLAVANKFQRAFLRLPPKARTIENEELYQCFIAAQEVFSSKVRRVIAAAHLNHVSDGFACF